LFQAECRQYDIRNLECPQTKHH